MIIEAAVVRGGRKPCVADCTSNIADGSGVAPVILIAMFAPVPIPPATVAELSASLKVRQKVPL